MLNITNIISITFLTQNSNLNKKFLMENFIFCAVSGYEISTKTDTYLEPCQIQFALENSNS